MTAADSPTISQRGHNLHFLPASGGAGGFGSHCSHSCSLDRLHIQCSKKGSKLQVWQLLIFGNDWPNVQLSLQVKLPANILLRLRL